MFLDKCHNFEMNKIFKAFSCLNIPLGFSLSFSIILSNCSIKIQSASKELVFCTLPMVNIETRDNIKFLTRLSWKCVKIIEVLQHVEQLFMIE